MSMKLEDEEPKNQSDMTQSCSLSLSSKPAAAPAMSNWLNWFNDKRLTVPIAISILISAGFLCGMVFRTRKEKMQPRRLARSASIGLLHGGKLAMQRLLDSHIALANLESLTKAEDELQILLDQEKHNFRKLQSVVAKLEMSQKEAEATNKLNKAISKAIEQDKHHEAYELEMLVVEMLIYQGRYREAMDCKCLNDEDISDARRPLYKAIIYILEGNVEQAKTYWRKFQDIREEYKLLHSSDAAINEVADNFDKFKDIVNSLQEEIGKSLDCKKKKEAQPPNNKK